MNTNNTKFNATLEAALGQVIPGMPGLIRLGGEDLRRNRFGEPCAGCGVRVPSREGVLLGSKGAWSVQHKQCYLRAVTRAAWLEAAPDGDRREAEPVREPVAPPAQAVAVVKATTARAKADTGRFDLWVRFFDGGWAKQNGDAGLLYITARARHRECMKAQGKLFKQVLITKVGVAPDSQVMSL